INAANKGVHLTGEQWSGDYYAKFQTQIAGGVVPDLVYTQGQNWQPYALKGVLTPLDSYITRDNYTAPWPTKVAAYAQHTQIRGKTYQCPANSTTSVIMYNKDVFDHFKVQYPKDGWTVKEFRDTALALTKPDPKDRWYGYQNFGDYYYFLAAWIRADGD